MTKRLDPFAFFAIQAGVVLLLALVACLAYPLRPPMLAYTVTSVTGYRVNPMGGGDTALHRGVDLVGPSGCAILAAAPGIVVEHWPVPGGKWRGHPIFGGYIVLDHGGGVYTAYGHLSKTFVHTGQRVYSGEVIARQGRTGDATGEHLHFEVVVNPMIFFEAPLGIGEAERRGLLR